MIVLDASAIVALVAREPDAADLARRLDRIPARFERRFASTISVWEAACAIARLWPMTRPDALGAVEDFLRLSSTTSLAPDRDITALAVAAAERYGRGPGYPGILNLGDCFSYATARHLGAALLYKGDDFARTDIPAA